MRRLYPRTNSDADVFQWEEDPLHLCDKEPMISDPYYGGRDDDSELAVDDCQSLCGSSSATDSIGIHTPVIPRCSSEVDFEEVLGEHGSDIETSTARGDFKDTSAYLFAHLQDDPDTPGAPLMPSYPKTTTNGKVPANSPWKANDPMHSASRNAQNSSRVLERDSENGERIPPQTWPASSDDMLEHIFDLLLSCHLSPDLSNTRVPAAARDAVGRCLLVLESYLVQVGIQQGDGSAALSDAPSTSAESAVLYPSPGSHGQKRGFEPEPRKNSGQRDDETPGEGNDGDEEEQGSADSNKAKKSRAEGLLKLSCPYRKRNPLRFNVRDSPQCSLQSYSLLANLK